VRYPVLLMFPWLVMSCGCITHTVRVEPAATAGSKPQLAVTSRLSATPRALVTISKTLPVEVRISAWCTGEAGLERDEQVVRSPLVWWQRFPCDIVSDLAPRRLVAETISTIAYLPVPSASEALLTLEAQRHGFAHAPSP